MKIDFVNSFDLKSKIKAIKLNYVFTSDLIHKILNNTVDPSIDETEDWVETLDYRKLYSLSRIVNQMINLEMDEEDLELINQFKDILSLTQCLYRLKYETMDGFDGDQYGLDFLLEIQGACDLQIGKRRGTISPEIRLSDIFKS